jgi:drug/metabolite transporter (DMT)-like permease
MPSGTDRRTIFLSSAALLCFAANSILCRLAVAYDRIDAATFTTLRVAGAAILLCLIVLHQKGTFPRLGKTNPWSVAALFCYQIFFSFGYLQLNAGSGALILVGASHLTMFVAGFWAGERFTTAQWTGLTIALFGFLYFLLPVATAPEAIGAIYMCLSGVGFGIFSLLARGNEDAVEANATTFVICLLPTLAINLARFEEFQSTSEGVLLAVASGAFATGVGYILWYLALRTLPALRAATLQLAMPLLVALIGVAVLSEPLTVRLLICLMLVLGGTALVLSRVSR